MSRKINFSGKARRTVFAFGIANWAVFASSPDAGGQDMTALDQRLQKMEARLESIESRLAPNQSAAEQLETPAAALVDAPPADEPASQGESAPGGAAVAQFQLPEEFAIRPMQSERSADIVEGPSDDPDLDGLTNAEEAQLHTNATNPDTDGDALLDGWEVHGVNGLDLRAMGASPLHKDIFVEMDFMKRSSASSGLGPNAAVLAVIRQTFADAPVVNPDGTTGINIHLEMGNEVPYDADLNPYDTEFFALKGVHFDSARAPVFHYMIWANGYGGGGSSGVSMSIPHSDFIVTLGLWNGGGGGTDNEKIGTFIHELGHNLGLTHGGSGHANYKPNHISVMNYSFQTIGIKVFGTRRFDYQRFSLPTLNEQLLKESVGLSSSLLSGYSTIIQSSQFPSREVAADGAIDWNNNGVINPGTVSVDLNIDNQLGNLSGTPDQWNSIIYNGGSIGAVSSLEFALDDAQTNIEPFPYVELTEEMVVQPGP